MAFDLPVVAHASTGVTDTLGGAGISITDKDPDTILAHLLRLHDDRHFREELIRLQRQRVLRFTRTRIQAQLRRWLADVGAVSDDKARASRYCLGNYDDDDVLRPTKGTHYILEGTFETYYSMAIVNSNLALTLDKRPTSVVYIEPADVAVPSIVNISHV